MANDENKAKKKDDKDDDKKPICRDYMKDICLRGDRCRYQHPPQKRVFCHDYQNGKCRRHDCRYIHCSNDDEEHFKRTGELPPHISLLYPDILSSRVNTNNNIDRDEQTFCRDYLNGECSRNNCRYIHERIPVQTRYPEDLRYNDLKRRRYDDGPPLTTVSYDQLERRVWCVEEENSNLRRTLTELRKRLMDLQATNEFLLEQNAQMRIHDKVSLTAVTVPTVTLTNALSQAQVNGGALGMGQVTTIQSATGCVPVSIATVTGSSVTNIKYATPVSLAPVVSMAPQQQPPVQQQATIAGVVGVTQNVAATAAAAQPPAQPDQPQQSLIY